MLYGNSAPTPWSGLRGPAPGSGLHPLCRLLTSGPVTSFSLLDPHTITVPSRSSPSFLKTRVLCIIILMAQLVIHQQCRRYRRHRFDPWVGKIPWRRKWQPTPVLLPGESHGQRRPAGCSPQGCRVGHNWAIEHACNKHRGQRENHWNPGEEIASKQTSDATVSGSTEKHLPAISPGIPLAATLLGPLPRLWTTTLISYRTSDSKPHSSFSQVAKAIIESPGT